MAMGACFPRVPHGNLLIGSWPYRRILLWLQRAATPPPGSNGPQHHHRSPSLFDTTPVGLDQFIALLPTVVRKCETRNLKKCEPVKALLK